MAIKRRDALKALGGSTLALLANPVFAMAKSQRVLILGGTGFIGPHFVSVPRRVATSSRCSTAENRTPRPIRASTN